MRKTDGLNINDFILKEDIGEGNFGKVKLCIYKQTGEEYAIKILDKEKIKDKMKNTFFKENEIAKKFNHINVIYVFEIFEDKDNFYLVMEYCKKGELFDYIVNHQRLSENESAIFFYQLINGVEHIHNKGIAHRDLKPENLLLTNDKILKIIDFGLSHEFNGIDLLKTKCGSPSYAAPEIICSPFYDGFKTDIWCCGIILYAMLCGFLPFEGDDNTLLFRNILECDPEMPDWLSRTSRDLIIRILNPDPDERITLDEIKQHKFYLKGKRLCNINYEDINDIINKRGLRHNDNSSINLNEKNKKEEDNFIVTIVNEENNYFTNDNSNSIDNNMNIINKNISKKNEKEIFNKKNENDMNKIDNKQNNNYKYKYCNTISGNLTKLKPFNKLYNIKNNNSINSFRKKIMEINNNINKKKFGEINNKNININVNTNNSNNIANNNSLPASITITENINNINHVNNLNTNFNSINSSKHLNNNKEKKFTTFLSRLNSCRKPLFLKIINSSISNDIKNNKIDKEYNEGKETAKLNVEENNLNKKYISFLNKMKNNFRKFNQQKKIFNNNVQINTISCTNRFNSKNKSCKNNKYDKKNGNDIYNNIFRDKLYTRLYSNNINTPIHIKKNNIPISTELNINNKKNEKIKEINNSEPKPIVYCSNLNININNININQKTNHNTLSIDKKKPKNNNKIFDLSNNTTKANSSKKLSLKINTNSKEEDKISKSNKSNDLFLQIKIKDNYQNKINLSNIIQKRLKNNKNTNNLYTNVRHITENYEKSKKRVNSSTKKNKNNNNKRCNSKINNKKKDDMFLRMFNHNYLNINNIDNINQKFLTMFNNHTHSRSSKKINKKISFK